MHICIYLYHTYIILVLINQYNLRNVYILIVFNQSVLLYFIVLIASNDI